MAHEPSTACESMTAASVDAASDLSIRLDRAGECRLERQGTQLHQRRATELGDIMQRAGRLNAQRLTNQDYTPASVRRIECLERVSEQLGDLADARQLQRADAGPLPRPHEAFLHMIAARLRRIDGRAGLLPDQRAEHPRDYMRRTLLRSIDRLHRLGPPAMATRQRFCREPLHG
ncbi:hypothetical protein LPJ61_003039 [Coemansia biformis]|uniref:Uncharacterized protein n=1 Tax=Coemansia biformis TaxID=1286918 RepID=A0A9W8CYL2_9FUNG|nr:hypothetical protein LPJ61_003039 [Coemansia biformis]